MKISPLSSCTGVCMGPAYKARLCTFYNIFSPLKSFHPTAIFTEANNTG